MKMLEDLAEVVRMIDGARPGTYTSVAHRCASFLQTHHATIRDMAARLEAAERDAARYRWLRDSSGRGLCVREKIIKDAPCDGNMHPAQGDYLDAAIDQAMQETGR